MTHIFQVYFSGLFLDGFVLWGHNSPLQKESQDDWFLEGL